MSDSQNNYINLTINGKLFPLWILQNFKKYKLNPIIKVEGEDPCKMKTEDQILELREYQKFVGAYLDYRSPYKSILLYHGLGSGKTATAINVYNVLYQHSRAWNVFILIKASLYKNPWLKDLNTWLNKDDNEGRWSNIRFVHYDAPNADKDFMNKFREADASKKNLYIIDEAHNFINNVYNNITNKQGKRAQNVYDYLIREQKETDSTRIILMSGTPAINEPYELALIFNLLRPELFPNNESKFNETYIDPTSKSGLNPDTKNMFQRRILGLVSYYQGSTSDLYAKRKLHQQNLVMDEYQLQVYRYNEEIEKKLEANRRPNEKVKTQSVYRSYTRQASNFVFPVMEDDMSGENRPRPSKFRLTEHEIEKLLEGRTSEEVDQEQADKEQLYLTTLSKYVTSFDAYLGRQVMMDKRNNLSIEDDIEIFKNEYKFKFVEFYNGYKNKSNLLQTMYKCSCKMTAIIFNSFRSSGPVLVYSNYVRMEGLEIFKIYLKYFGYVGAGVEGGIDFHRYTEFAGSMDRELRNSNLYAFNNIKNKDGSIIKIILISPAGSEGISLKNVRQVHILEPYWNEVRIEQLIGRAIRQCSHKDIPIADRYVDIYRYNAVTGLDDRTTDTDIQAGALRKSCLIESFLSTIKEAAVDCELFKEHNMIDAKYKCFKFDESSYFDKYIGPAYKEDIYYDKKMNNGLNATTSTSKQIKAVRIKAVIRLENNFSSPSDYWYNQDTGIVYDFELKYPVGKVFYIEGIPSKIDKATYIIDQSITIPRIRRV